jgi:hypothetical protein
MPHSITLEGNFFLILMRRKKHVEAKVNEKGCTYNKGEEKKIDKLTPFFLVCMCCEPLFGFCLGVSIIWAMGVLYRKWPSSFWSPRIYVCVIFAICWDSLNYIDSLWLLSDIAAQQERCPPARYNSSCELCVCVCLRRCRVLGLCSSRRLHIHDNTSPPPLRFI